MDTNDRFIEKLLDQPKIFTDKSTDLLDIRKLPNNLDNIPFREEQLNRLLPFFKSLRHDYPSTSGILTGMHGTGKSTTVKLLTRKALNAFDGIGVKPLVIHVNCVNNNTYTKIFREVISHFPKESQKRACKEEGLKYPLSKKGIGRLDVFNILKTCLLESQKVTLVVLDEFDKMQMDRIPESTQKGSNRVIIDLLEISGAINSPNLKISLMAIVNLYDSFLQLVDSDALSRLGTVKIHFPTYKYKELIGILLTRKEAFHPEVLKKESLELIAKTVADSGGDARKAIEILTQAGAIADADGDHYVGVDHVKIAIKYLHFNDLTEALKTFSLHHTLTFLGFYFSYFVNKEADKRTPTSRFEVYECYDKIISDLINPKLHESKRIEVHSSFTVWKYLKTFVDTGYLVKSKKSGFKDGVRNNYFMDIKYDKEFVKKELLHQKFVVNFRLDELIENDTPI